MTGHRVPVGSLTLALLVCGSAAGGELRFLNDPSLGSFVDLTGQGVQVIDVGFDGVAALPLEAFAGNFLLPAPITVGQNGGVAFGEAGSNGLVPENEPIPGQGAFGGGQSALLFWDDIDDKDGDVGYVLLENEANVSARLIIQWSFHDFDDAGSTIRFQLHVYPNLQPTGIYAQYVYTIEGPATGAGASATIGYQDGSAGFGDVPFSFCEPDAVFDGTVLSLFIPDASDLDQNGGVDILDAMVLLMSWGPCGDCQECPADLTGDCAVDIADLAILLTSWGF